MPSCVVNGCRNYDRKRSKEKDNISYYRFPNDPLRNEEWCFIIRQQRADPCFKANEYLRVCSAHFTEDDFVMTKSGLRKLKPTAVPQIKDKSIYSEEAIFSEFSEATNFINSEEELLNVDVNDLLPILDTPMETSLRRKLKKFKSLNSTKVKKIKALQKQNRRLKKRCKYLEHAIEELQDLNE